MSVKKDPTTVWITTEGFKASYDPALHNTARINLGDNDRVFSREELEDLRDLCVVILDAMRPKGALA